MEWLLEMDGQLLLWLKETFAHPVLDRLMIFISALGDSGFCWIALAALFLLLGMKRKVWRQRGCLLLFSLAIDALLCNVLLKPLVGRTRPYELLGYELLIPPMNDPSFPSGHTAASFAAAAALFAMDWRWGIAAYVFAAVMGFSRLYLGVHFPTDVLAGALLGIAAAKLALFLWNKWKDKSANKSDL